MFNLGAELAAGDRRNSREAAAHRQRTSERSSAEIGAGFNR